MIRLDKTTEKIKKVSYLVSTCYRFLSNSKNSEYVAKYPTVKDATDMGGSMIYIWVTWIQVCISEQFGLTSELHNNME